MLFVKVALDQLVLQLMLIGEFLWHKNQLNVTSAFKTDKI